MQVGSGRQKELYARSLLRTRSNGLAVGHPTYHVLKGRRMTDDSLLIVIAWFWGFLLGWLVSSVRTGPSGGRTPHRGTGGPPDGLTPEQKQQWYRDHMPEEMWEFRKKWRK